MNNLNELARTIYEDNKQRGFDAAKENVGQTLMLVVSELAEALEADRKGYYADVEAFESYLKYCSSPASSILFRNPEEAYEESFENNIKNTFEDEMADTLIRVLDMCGALKIDIEKHVELKLRYNATRPYKHGKKY